MTAVNVRLQLFFWIAAVVLTALFLFTFNTILAPFIVGIVIAYLLNPIVIIFERKSLSRTIASIVILSTFLLVVLVLFAFLIPPLYREAVQFAESAPDYFEQLLARLQPYIGMVGQEINTDDLEENIGTVFRNNASNALNFSSNLFSGILSGGRAVIGTITFILITPLVSFFVMNEWPAITKWVDDLIPRHRYKEIKGLLWDIDKKIAGFVRGQMLVAASLGIVYALALTIAGLEFSVLIGLLAGLLSIIPLFGSIVGLLVSVIVAWFQSADITFVLIIAAIFLVGQVLEGNVITPKLLGGSVGMHPLWILFSIMAGSALFGIVGMMLAVPVAATLGVLTGFALKKYKESQYFDS